MRYKASKYLNGLYCGSEDFISIEDCIAWANDGFCTRVTITDTYTEEKRVYRL